ncbi:HAD-IA family hydrolase [Phenylobacterium sp.]|uniref:HAD-IA family hydrolase n=1 Tax=Phenylobacterium sp. TaxID=1871053 RepID=UPI002F3F1E77
MAVEARASAGVTADGTALAGAVIALDLDGTLVDTAPDLIGTLNWLLAGEGIAPLSLDEARPFIGRGARWMIERGFQAADAPLAPDRVLPLFERFIARYETHIADESRPFPGAVAALETLKAQGAKLCVCTNKLTGLSTTLLDALDLSRLFDAVVGADATPAIKPDPRHIEAAVAACGGSISRTVMVGDAATDARAARAARVPLILVSFGYTDIPARELAPDVLIDSFDQLPRACAQLLGAVGNS